MKKLISFVLIFFAICVLSCAVFADEEYTVSGYAVPANGGHVDGGGKGTVNDNIPLAAVANDGFEFDYWEEDGASIDASQSDVFTAFKTRTLIAHFKELPPIETFTVSASVYPNGAGSVNPPSYTYAAGTNHTFIATENNGYTFDGWYEGGSKISSKLVEDFTAFADRTIEARFIENKTYIISTGVFPAMSGLTNGGGTFSATDTVELEAIAKPGYEFFGWSLNGTTVAGPDRAVYSFTPTTSGTYIANFVNNTSKPFIITYKPGGAEETSTYTDEKLYNTEINLRGVTYHKKGYVQTGWATADRTVSYDLNGTYRQNSNIELYPTWAVAGEHTLTVYYNAACGNIKTGETLVKNGDSFKIKDDGSATFHFTAIPDYYTGSVVLNGVKQNFKDDTFTVPGRSTDQTLKVTFYSRFGNPATGDDSHLLLWSVLGGVSLAAVTTGMVLKKKSKS